MTVWEFSLRYDDGTAVAQSVIAEGATEVDAFENARPCVGADQAARLARPGRAASTDVAARWRDVLGDAFPMVVSDEGRLARYARGTGVRLPGD
jgi:hypothetical protein